MTDHCSAAVIRPQAAISSTVRRQPSQTRFRPSTQTLIHGDTGPDSGIVTRRLFKIGR
jgi:hypothetical protein